MTTRPEPSGELSAFLALPLGSRVVIRHRITGGAGAERPTATDALGFLVRVSASECEVRTRHGDVTVQLTNIVAAKQVPPAPPRRPPRRSEP